MISTPKLLYFTRKSKIRSFFLPRVALLLDKLENSCLLSRFLSGGKLNLPTSLEILVKPYTFLLNFGL